MMRARHSLSVAIAVVWLAICGVVLVNTFLNLQRGNEQDRATGLLECLSHWHAIEWLTLSLVLVTIVQVWVYWRQATYMRSGLVLTRQAADVATNTLNMANRPRLVIRPITVSGFENRRIQTELSDGYAWITNVGVLPARLLHFWAGWLFTRVLPLTNPALVAIDTSTAESEVLPGFRGKRHLPDWTVSVEAFSVINNAVDAIEKGLSPLPMGVLYLFGYIKYKDEIGLRRTYFLFSYDPKLGAFKQEEHPNYSYEE